MPLGARATCYRLLPDARRPHRWQDLAHVTVADVGAWLQRARRHGLAPSFIHATCDIVRRFCAKARIGSTTPAVMSLLDTVSAQCSGAPGGTRAMPHRYVAWPEAVPRSGDLPVGALRTAGRRSLCPPQTTKRWSVVSLQHCGTTRMLRWSTNGWRRITSGISPHAPHIRL